MKIIMEYTLRCDTHRAHIHTYSHLQVSTEPTNQKLDRNYENNNNSSPLVYYSRTHPSGHRLHHPCQHLHIAHNRLFDFDAAVVFCCLAPLLCFDDWRALCVRNRSKTRSLVRHHSGDLHYTQHSFQRNLLDPIHRN